MTLTTHDTWFESAMNTRVICKRVTAAFTAEAPVLTAAQLGLSEIYEVSGTVGLEGAEALVFGITSDTAGGPGKRIRLRAIATDVWNTGNVTYSVRLTVKGLAA